MIINIECRKFQKKEAEILNEILAKGGKYINLSLPHLHTQRNEYSSEPSEFSELFEESIVEEPLTLSDHPDDIPSSDLDLKNNALDDDSLSLLIQKGVFDGPDSVDCALRIPFNGISNTNLTIPHMKRSRG